MHRTPAPLLSETLEVYVTVSFEDGALVHLGSAGDEEVEDSTPMSLTSQSVETTI